MRGVPHPGRLFLSLWLIIAFFADPLLEINTVRYLYLARAVVEEGRLAVDSYAHPSRGDLAVRDGHYYCGAMPGPGLLLVPHAALARALKTVVPLRQTMLLQLLAVLLFSAPLAAASSLLLIHLLDLCGLDLFRRTLLGITATLGTPLFFFSIRPSEYPLVTFLGLGLVKLLVDRPAGSVRSGLLAGLVLSLFLLVNDLAFLLMLLLLAAAWPMRPLAAAAARWSAVLAGLVPGLVARGVYMSSCFGSPWASPYSYGASSGTIVQAAAGFSSAGAYACRLLQQAPLVLFDYTVGRVGLFLFAPVFLLLFVALARRQPVAPFPRLRAAVTVAFLANVAFCFSLPNGMWLSGATWGPRFLLYTSSLLFLVLGVSSLRVGRSTLLVLSLASLLVSAVGVQYGYNDNLLDALGCFLLGGPTTPSFRWFWLHWSLTPSPERIALVLEETPRLGHYYAFTHPTPFFAGLLLLLLLILLWLSPLTAWARAARAGGGFHAAR